MVIINRYQTDLLYASRVQVNETGTKGDLLEWLFNYTGINNTNYNSLIDAIDGWEAEADNSNLQGTDPSGNHIQVASLPGRPRGTKRP